MLAQLRHRVKDRLSEMKISAREASRRAGFNVGYVGDLIEGRSKRPEAERIVKLAEVLGIEPAELLQGGETVPTMLATGRVERMPAAYANSAPDSGMVPLLAARIALSERLFLDVGEEPVAQVPALGTLSTVPGAYAFAIPNEMNSPRYAPGEIVFISPAAPAVPGDYVFVRLASGGAGVARLESFEGDSKVVLRCIGAQREENLVHCLPLNDVAVIHKVVGSQV